MKKLLVLLSSIALVTILIFSSCSDPAKNSLYVGTYNGIVTFGSIKEFDVRTNPNGSVKVTKIGNRYTFDFSDDIPTIKNIKLSKKNETTQEYKKGLDRITVTKDKLNIFFTKDGENWTATCTHKPKEK